MKVVKIETTSGEVFNLYDVTETSENKEWYSVRTRDGYKRSVKKENIVNIKTFNEE